jgi:hypothetical protein
MQEDVRPDVLIPYSATADMERLKDSSISLISVRPETNKVNYEATIVQSVAPYAEAVYLANLSGELINNRAIVACHYSSQLQFAIGAKDEMARFPEMVARFEEKFKVNFMEAPIIGSFEALLDYRLREDADDLFATMVPDSDFLDMYGQTIKRIDGYYVMNYDMPAIITRHHEDTAMFILAVRLKDKATRFSNLHHLIYDNMLKNEKVEIIGPQERKRLQLEWYDQIRRTFHISRSHIEAMFDLTDYVFKNETERIAYADTPLGQKLISMGIIPEDQLEKRLHQLKDAPLVYIHQEDGSEKLVDIILEGKIKQNKEFVELDLEQCCRIFEKIDWERI